MSHEIRDVGRVYSNLYTQYTLTRAVVDKRITAAIPSYCNLLVRFISNYITACTPNVRVFKCWGDAFAPSKTKNVLKWVSELLCGVPTHTIYLSDFWLFNLQRNSVPINKHIFKILLLFPCLSRSLAGLLQRKIDNVIFLIFLSDDARTSRVGRRISSIHIIWFYQFWGCFGVKNHS